MPSPFPGMDPYLELPALWPEVHYKLIGAMQDHLNELLPERFVASVDRHVWIDAPEEEDDSSRYPDVFVTDSGKEKKNGGRSTLALSVAPQTFLMRRTSRKGHPYLKILELEGKRVVTVVELLSPSNKAPGPNREAYLAKRQEYLQTNINLVEIDLLRQGKRIPLKRVNWDKVDYVLIVSPVETEPRAGVWFLTVRETLPEILVPLTPGEKDIPLPLQECLDRAYRLARFDRKVNYDRPPVPPLKEPDATWARELVAQRQGGA